MPTRWEVKDHMYRSALKPLDRLVMHTLIARARVPDAVIPPEHQPSIRVLVAETGMGKHTLQRALARLEDEGWIEVGRPTKAEQFAGASNAYAVTIPSERCTHTGPTPVPSVDPPLGPEQAQGWARSGPLSTSPSPEISPGSSEAPGDDPWSQEARTSATARRYRSEEAKADERARCHTCPSCGVGPGHECMRNGVPWRIATHTHQERRDLADERRSA